MTGAFFEAGMALMDQPIPPGAGIEVARDGQSIHEALFLTLE